MAKKPAMDPPAPGQTKTAGKMPNAKAHADQLQSHMAETSHFNGHGQQEGAPAGDMGDAGARGVGDTSRGRFPQGQGASDANYTTGDCGTGDQ